MVCHETYKDENNNWISPDEIISINGKKYLKNDNSKEVKVGPSESMSKSKKNTIDPEYIINNFGADAARLFILSDSPPEKDVQWSEEGISASSKFIQKLWVLHQIVMDEIQKNNLEDVNNELSKFTNKFIKKISTNLENFSYNIIIANLHEMYSSLTKLIKEGNKQDTIKENYIKILTTLMPVIPHFSNECLKSLNMNMELTWPTYNESEFEEKSTIIVIQINGKKRAIINAEKNINEDNLIKLICNDEKIKKYFDENKIKKKIYIKNKLINIIC